MTKTVVIDDTELTIPFLSEVCAFCRHLRKDGIGRTCDAFPDGIPLLIWRGENRHRDPYKGDHGIQFEAIEKG